MDTTLTVVEEIADREETESTELPPLYEVIDPRVLESFVQLPVDESLSIGFLYCGYVVTISNKGNVKVSTPTDRHLKAL